MVCMAMDPKIRYERHKLFMEANWIQLAALAYAGYQEKGRGMLFLSDEEFVHHPIGVPVQYHPLFIAEGSAEFDKIGSEWPGEEEAEWVINYDPAAEILVGVMQDDGEFGSYRLEGHGKGSPAQLAARLAA